MVDLSLVVSLFVVFGLPKNSASVARLSFFFALSLIIFFFVLLVSSPCFLHIILIIPSRENLNQH